MKRIFFVLILTIFNINTSFASPESFKKKFIKFEELADADNFSAAQNYLLVNMAKNGFKDCFPSTKGNGYTCVLAEQFCVIHQNTIKTSIICLSEKDIDRVLAYK